MGNRAPDAAAGRFRRLRLTPCWAWNQGTSGECGALDPADADSKLVRTWGPRRCSMPVDTVKIANIDVAVVTVGASSGGDSHPLPGEVVLRGRSQLPERDRLRPPAGQDRPGDPDELRALTQRARAFGVNGSNSASELADRRPAGCGSMTVQETMSHGGGSDNAGDCVLQSTRGAPCPLAPHLAVAAIREQCRRAGPQGGLSRRRDRSRSSSKSTPLGRERARKSHRSRPTPLWRIRTSHESGPRL